MHVGWSAVFSPHPDRPRPTAEALAESIGSRLHLAPRFRQRLAFTPGGFAEPVWVDDERFDIAEHVVALAEPGQAMTRARFDELCDAVLSLPLDRSRALWSLHVAPLLDDGTLGLVMKAHHAMVDGKSAVELALLLLDLSPDAPEAEADDWAPQPAPSPARLALDAMVDTGGESLRAAAGLARAVASPRLAGTLRRAALAAAVASRPQGAVVLTNCPSCLSGLGRNAAVAPARHVAVELARAISGEGWREIFRRRAARAQAVRF
jgi:diacylglycerol O-acyltransferase